MTDTDDRGLGESYYQFRTLAVVLVAGAAAVGLSLLRLAPESLRGVLLVAVAGGLILGLSVGGIYVLRDGVLFDTERRYLPSLAGAVVCAGLLWLVTTGPSPTTVAGSAVGGIGILAVVTVFSLE